ncbi:MAG: RnfABCDGE type electron transport complex subunit B [Atopobiaceae bacterium]|jgi:electron transport complex protein RnfB
MQSIVLTVVLVTGLGLIGALILSFSSHALHVEEDERLEKICAILPGLNCGSCGHPGCEGYAHAVLEGAPCNDCVPGGAKVAGELAEFMGVTQEGVKVKRAAVACNGAPDRIRGTAVYDGPKSCRIFSTMSHVSRSCTYGCIGFGDCVDVCAYGALKINEHGIAEVNPQRCVGCGECTKVCPRHVISIQEKGAASVVSFVACQNPNVGKRAKESCANVCIGCGKCDRACPEKCITIDDHVAKIDTVRCSGCMICVDQCPVGAIHPLTFCAEVQ